MNITKQAKAKQLAQNVAEFIAHNQIDTSVFSMDLIVEQYFQAQMKAIDEAGLQALDILSKV